MSNKLGQAAEDYLKVIYEIAGNNRRAATTQIAERLKVKPASVTGMLQKLSLTNPPLVDYQKHHGAALTEMGAQVALEIIRHHRLLESFLHNKLGYTWDEVHHEADELEHVISEKFEERIANVLGHPSHDPHGDPIPTPELSIPDQKNITLGSLRPGQSARISRVNSSDPDLLKFLGDKGLIPDTYITVLGYSDRDATIKIQVFGHNDYIALKRSITNQLFIDNVN